MKIKSKSEMLLGQREIILTADGSHSLFVPELNESYHSKFGAVAESQHIYINTGLKTFSTTSDFINIFEVGFGTGLNALLTYHEALISKKNINYSGIENYPLQPDFIKQLNYAKEVSWNIAEEIFYKLHEADWDTEIMISDFFTLTKINQNLLDYTPVKGLYDLVYFDAFGPDVQSELWTEEIFKKIASSMKCNGILVTYSTKGNVKRALKKSGFSIEKLPGPQGKREILRAKLLM